MIAVATLGAIEDWSAYIGSVAGENHDLEYEDVLSKGTKLPQRIAEVIFPEWKKFAWRG